MCIPDGGRFRFAFSEIRLRDLFDERRSEAEALAKSVQDLMTYQVKTNKAQVPFSCKDYYEGVAGDILVEHVRWNGDALEDEGRVYASEVKGSSKTVFRRFMYVW